MSKYKINKGFITQKMGDKVTIFSGEESVLYTLNDTAAYIFQGLKLGWEEKKIIDGLIKKYKITENKAKKDVEEFTDELTKNQILITE